VVLVANRFHDIGGFAGVDSCGITSAGNSEGAAKASSGNISAGEGDNAGGGDGW
jgi:hypothetical protein